MKEWFKHTHGYLNIDDKFIYVTKTGNWSEISDLTEKNAKGYALNDIGSKFKIGIFILVFAVAIIYIIISSINRLGNFIPMLIGLSILFYFVYQYLISEYGASFMIPKDKVKAIEIDDKGYFSIKFLDAQDNNTFNDFHGLNEKGILFFKRLRNEFICNHL